MCLPGERSRQRRCVRLWPQGENQIPTGVIGAHHNLHTHKPASAGKLGSTPHAFKIVRHGAVPTPSVWPRVVLSRFPVPQKYLRVHLARQVGVRRPARAYHKTSLPAIRKRLSPQSACIVLDCRRAREAGNLHLGVSMAATKLAPASACRGDQPHQRIGSSQYHDQLSTVLS